MYLGSSWCPQWGASSNPQAPNWFLRLKEGPSIWLVRLDRPQTPHLLTRDSTTSIQPRRPRSSFINAHPQIIDFTRRIIDSRLYFYDRLSFLPFGANRTCI